MLSPEQKRKFIVALSFRFGVDPRAALAVAMSEGGFGGAIGDAGTSFGPFQLHQGGALPAGKTNQWANSRGGIRYAMRQIDSVAGGLRGRNAIANIVSRFERPAAPAAEIARAWGYYGDIGLPKNSGQDMWRNKDRAQNAPAQPQAPQVSPVQIHPQQLNFSSPTDLLASLSSGVPFLTQGGKPVLAAAAPQGSRFGSAVPNPTTIQGMSSTDLYQQLQDLRRELLA